MKLFSKKALALVLTLAMLMSCAVFSFGADAAMSGCARNTYDDADTGAWKIEADKQHTHSDSSKAYAGYYDDEGNGTMKIGFGAGGEGKLAGYWFHSNGGNWHNDNGNWSSYGNGKYMVTLRYKVLSMASNSSYAASAQVAIRFGMADRDYWYFSKDVDKSLGNFNSAGVGSANTVVAVAGASDVGAGWQTAVGYLEVTGAGGETGKAGAKHKPHIFATLGGGYQDGLGNTEILIDDVYIYQYDTIEDVTTPDPNLVATKLWENDFQKLARNNWASYLHPDYIPEKYITSNPHWDYNFHSSPDGMAAHGKSSAGNYALLENGVMKIGFGTNESAESYISAFMMKHQASTSGTSLSYGTNGKDGAHSRDGNFKPVAGKYAVKFDYKVKSFNAATTSSVNIGAGYYTSEKYLDGNRALSFINVNKTLLTVDASDVSDDWKTAAGYIEIGSDLWGGLLMYAAVANNDAELTGCEILIDNVEIFTYTTLPQLTVMYNGSSVGTADALPGCLVNLPAVDALSVNVPDGYELQYYADAECTTPADAVVCGNTGTTVYAGLVKLPKKALYENTFSAPTDSNWGNRLNKASGWISKGSITTTTYLADEKAMELTLTGAAANGAGNDSYTAGFQMFNEAADVGTFTVPAGYYVVQFDYKVTDFTAEADAALDIMATFAKDYYWDGSDNPPKNKLMKDGFNNSKYPVSGVAATVTASDKGGDWVTVTKLFTIEGTVNRNLHIHIKAQNGFTGSMADTKVLIDNVKLYQYDINFDQSVKDRTAYLYKGNAGTAEEPIWTNLHSYVGNTAKEGIYTSLRLAAKYTAGDSTGNTIIIDGVEYELAERGILVGVEGSELNLNNRPTYKWKASKTENFDQYWTPNPVVESDEPIEISYTLRLANMGEAWFTDTTKYQFRSYYKVKAPDFESDEGFLVYGGISEAFTFGELADTFTKTENWFPGLS